MSDELSFVVDEPLEVVITPDGCDVMIGDALGITWRGAYAAGTTYNLQDAVQYGGDSYISLVNANTGHTPDASPTYWSLMVEGGGGATLSDADPQPLGTAGPGTSEEASRGDHVHAMPSAADVGAAAASHAHVAADVTDLGGAAVLDVGTVAGTVAAGDDARLSDTRDPNAHAHVAADVTDLGGAATLDVGTTAGTVCAGDDSRLSDDRDPTAHEHVAGDIDAEASTDGQVLTSDGAGNAAWKDAAGGVSAHGSLSQLDYASAGHTDFQPAISGSGLWVPSGTTMPSRLRQRRMGEDVCPVAAVANGGSPFAETLEPSATGDLTQAQLEALGWSFAGGVLTHARVADGNLDVKASGALRMTRAVSLAGNFDLFVQFRQPRIDWTQAASNWYPGAIVLGDTVGDVAHAIGHWLVNGLKAYYVTGMTHSTRAVGTGSSTNITYAAYGGSPNCTLRICRSGSTVYLCAGHLPHVVRTLPPSATNYEHGWIVAASVSDSRTFNQLEIHANYIGNTWGVGASNVFCAFIRRYV